MVLKSLWECIITCVGLDEGKVENPWFTVTLSLEKMMEIIWWYLAHCLEISIFHASLPFHFHVVRLGDLELLLLSKDNHGMNFLSLSALAGRGVLEENEDPQKISDSEWKKRLTPQQYDVCRNHGTERVSASAHIQFPNFSDSITVMRVMWIVIYFLGKSSEYAALWVSGQVFICDTFPAFCRRIYLQQREWYIFLCLLWSRALQVSTLFSGCFGLSLLIH